MSGFNAPPQKYAEPIENKRVFANPPRLNRRVSARMGKYPHHRVKIAGKRATLSGRGRLKLKLKLAIPGGLELLSLPVESRKICEKSLNN
jgi:hypothetical protein